MMTKQKKMQPHNPNTKPPHSGVVWSLWYAADSAYALGQLVAIDYSDATPDVAFTYDRLGRQLTVTDILGTRTNVYDALNLLEERHPSDAARYHYDAAENPVDRAELGLDVTNSFNNLNQIVTGSWTGATLTVAGSVNYPAGSISVNNTHGTVYPDSSFDVAAVPGAPGINTLVATYVGPAFTNVPMTATDTTTVALGTNTFASDFTGYGATSTSRSFPPPAPV